METNQKIKEIEGALEVLPHRNTGIPQKWHEKYISLALEVIRELQVELEIAEKAEINKNLTLTLSSVLAENTALKARLQPTPEAPEIDKITCLEADIALRDDRIQELEKQLDRVRDTEALRRVIHSTVEMFDGEVLDIIKQLQNYILGGEGGK